jgi:phosphatidate cytidylyltransferase
MKKISPRILTALVGIPVVLFLAYSGGLAFKIFVLLLALGALRELDLAIRKSEDYGGSKLLGSVGYISLIFAVWNGPSAFWALGTLVALLILGVLFYDMNARTSLASIAVTMLCTLYISLFGILPLLREEDAGAGKWFWLMLFCVWASDTLAYYAGRTFGKHKISPLSPGKTWEGFAGGFIGAIICGFVASRWLGIPLAHGALFGACMGIAAPLGDLIESFFKRELGTKDMGAIFPGHGGILDRCDSILFCSLIAYFFSLGLIKIG